MEKIVGNAALLLIDMQGPFMGQVEKSTMDMILSNQKELISICRSKRIPVILIEYYAHGETCKEIREHTKGCITKTFEKKQDSAFESQDFISFLKKRRIKNLLISGLFGNACVFLTSKNATDKGFKVITSKDLVVMSSHIYQNQPVSGNSSILCWYKWNTLFLNSIEEIRKIDFCSSKFFFF